MTTMDFNVQMAKDVGMTIAEAVAKCADPILEPKYDGWRCIVVRDESGVSIFNGRSHKSYTGQLPELEADLAKLPVGTVLDGELVAMSFDGERMVNDFYRIHTVMRSKTSVPSQREGIKLIAFDVVKTDMPGIHAVDLRQRRGVVQHLLTEYKLEMAELTIQLPATQQEHDQLVAHGFEGSVVKDQSKGYAFGKRGHGWFKVKSTRTIDCIVMEVVMDGKGQHLGKAGKMVVGQIDGGEIVAVAKVNCLDNAQRDDATAHPERYVGRVIEVKVYGKEEGGGYRHPTPMRFRDDKPALDCVLSDR